MTIDVQFLIGVGITGATGAFTFGKWLNSLEKRVTLLERGSCNTYEDTNREIEQRLGNLELILSHKDQMISKDLENFISSSKSFIISKYQQNKSRCVTLYNSILILTDSVNELRRVVYGLETGLDRNGIKIRQQQDLVEKITCPEMDDSSFFND